MIQENFHSTPQYAYKNLFYRYCVVTKGELRSLRVRKIYEWADDMVIIVYKSKDQYLYF